MGPAPDNLKCPGETWVLTVSHGTSSFLPVLQRSLLCRGGLSSTQSLESGPGRPLGSIDTGLSTQPGQRSGPPPNPSLASLCLSISTPDTRATSSHLLLSPVPEGTFLYNMPARDITNIRNQSKTDQVSRLSGVFILYVLCCAKILQSCPTLCNPVDHSLSGSSVHGIRHVRIQE